MSFKRHIDSHGNYYELNEIKNSIPTIFIHGVGLDNTMWYPQKEHFHNKSVIFYDLLNHGQSIGGYKDLSFEIFSNQLFKIIDELKLEKINIVGFSIGALIAQHFTEKFYDKVNKLVLIGSVYKRSDEQIEIVQNRYKNAVNGASITIDSIKRWFSEKYLNDNPQVYDFLYNLLERKKDEDFLPAYKIFINSDNYNINYINFKMPTLVMTGENEVGSTPLMSEGISKEIKNSDLYIIKNAKHGATIEQANAVNNKLCKFLF
ncbi:alpha/beta hydrolase [Pelagibacterales bacterium SAG-MED31]|nr:alpha/beta hydrolase [Pelagibacterales bacterium SAG-MED31]